MIHLYIGDGKGKTTAALGLALRASGWKKRVYIAQFLKDKNLASGEISALQESEYITIERFHNQIHPGFVKAKTCDKKALCQSIQDACNQIERYIIEKKFDMFILDEILNAQNAGFCSDRAITRIMRKATSVELILTGRAASCAIICLSDYVSIIKKCKHPFDRKIPARKGVEY